MSYVNFPTVDPTPTTRRWYFPAVNPTPVDTQEESRGMYSPSLYKEQVIDPLDTQVGGSHYKNFVIQPVEYITKNKLGFCEGNIVKYISRYNLKGGVEDLDKIIHYAQLLKKLQK